MEKKHVYKQESFADIFKILNDDKVKDAIKVVLDLFKKLGGEDKPDDKPNSPEGVNRLKTKIHWVEGVKGEFEDLVVKILNVYLPEIYNSVEFKDQVLRANFKETNGKSNKEIYEYFMSGGSKFDEKDGEVDFKLIFYSENDGAYGYTYSNTDKIWINARFYDRDQDGKIDGNALKPHSLVNTITHEYLHNLGFNHFNGFDDTVPYEFGDIAGRLAYDMIERGVDLNPLETRRVYPRFTKES